jgi:hypothetical protein
VNDGWGRRGRKYTWPSLTIYSPVVSICTTYFAYSISAFYPEYIQGFCMILGVQQRLFPSVTLTNLLVGDHLLLKDFALYGIFNR